MVRLSKSLTWQTLLAAAVLGGAMIGCNSTTETPDSGPAAGDTGPRADTGTNPTVDMGTNPAVDMGTNPAVDMGTNPAVDMGTPAADMGGGGNIFVRIAHLSATAPAVRVCAKAAGGTFTAADVPVTPSLSFPAVTTYLTLPVGNYVARLVAGADANCANGVGADIPLPTGLAAGTRATVAAIGVFSTPATPAPTGFTVKAFVDLPATPAAGNVHLRVLHAAAGTNVPVFVGVPGGATGFAAGSPLFSNVAYAGNTAANSGIDPARAATNGFNPIAGAPLSVQLGVSANATATAFAWRSFSNVNLPALGILSAFAIDKPTGGGAGINIFVCDDTSTAGTPGAANTTCSIIQEDVANTIAVRIAHLSATAPAVRICAKLTSALPFTATDLPATPSLSFPTVTSYLSLPVGNYTARIVAGTDTNCGTGVGGDIALPTGLAAGTRATVAAIGIFTPTTPAPTGFTVKAFLDLPATPAAGNVHLRVLHAASGTNVPVFVGVPAGATGFAAGSPLFSNVAYAGNTAANSGIDPARAGTNGFNPISGAPLNVTLGVSATANAAAFAWRSTNPVALPALAILSAFAIDKTAGAGVDVYVCQDTFTSATAAANSTCAVIPGS